MLQMAEVLHLVEHVSFYSTRVLEFIGHKIGMEIIEYRRFSHNRSTIAHRVTESLKNAAYILTVRAGGFGIPALKRRVERRAPIWLSARDHMFVVMRRKFESAG